MSTTRYQYKLRDFSVLARFVDIQNRSRNLFAFNDLIYRGKWSYSTIESLINIHSYYYNILITFFKSNCQDF